MGEFASNCPISRPANVDLQVDWDLNGMLWNNDFGIFFSPVDEMLPLRAPVLPRNHTGSAQ